MNFYTPAGTVGSIIGFAAFGIAFLSTVAAIFWDIKKRMEMYDEEIENDRRTMRDLGMLEGAKGEKIEKELQDRLRGVVAEDTGDDQLMGAAANLTQEMYAAHL